MDKKTILVVEPFEKLNKSLIEGLTRLNYNIIPLFKGEMKSFDYAQSSTLDKIKNIIHRTLIKDINYYHVLLEKFYHRYTEELLERIIENNIEIDYALIMRPHGFSSKFYKLLNKLTPNISLYEYDGIPDTRAIILKNIQRYCKNIFLFDYDDLPKIPGARFSTNYHYNLPIDDSNNKFDFYFLGIYGTERIEYLNSFIEATPKSKKEIIVQIYSEPVNANKQIQFITQSKDYSDYLKEIKSSKAIIDLKSPAHNGLSFRSFEALNLRKKLITNNASVKNYNFYHPDNIYITDFKNFEGLDDFMEKPYHPIPEDIVYLYSLENWIKNIFQMDGYKPIPLPKIKTK